jgi:hypothetical protein
VPFFSASARVRAKQQYRATLRRTQPDLGCGPAQRDAGLQWRSGYGVMACDQQRVEITAWRSWANWTCAPQLCPGISVVVQVFDVGRAPTNLTGSSIEVPRSKRDRVLTEAAPQTGLAVRAYHRPLGFLLELFSVTIEIDGVPHKCEWGDSFFALPPGRHEVQVSCRWMFARHMGRNALTVEVEQGSAPSIQWTAPLTVFQKGRIARIS